MREEGQVNDPHFNVFNAGKETPSTPPPPETLSDKRLRLRQGEGKRCPGDFCQMKGGREAEEASQEPPTGEFN